MVIAGPTRAFGSRLVNAHSRANRVCCSALSGKRVCSSIQGANACDSCAIGVRNARIIPFVSEVLY